jgi:anti-anti-sigma factor
MGSYRISLSYQPVPPSARPLIFVSDIGAMSLSDARSRALAIFKELAEHAERKVSVQPTDRDLALEESDPRFDVLLELCALECRQGVYAMFLEGPLDGQTAMRFEKFMRKLENAGARSVALDLSLVQPVNSAGLGVLINLQQRMQVQLVNTSGTIKRMLELLGLEDLFIHSGSFIEAFKNSGGSNRFAAGFE